MLKRLQKLLMLFGMVALLGAAGCGGGDTVAADQNGGAGGGSGTLSGSVRDAFTGNPRSGVAVTVLSGSSVVMATTTDINGDYSMPIPVGNNYSALFVADGYVAVDYASISISADVTQFLEAILQIDNTHLGLGDVLGTIVDAFSGAAISGASLSVREGINTRSGTVLMTSTTDVFGDYAFIDLAAGNYTVAVHTVGFTTRYFSVLSLGGFTLSNQNSSVTPLLATGETRIVLSWGSTPSDLDSHLTGPTSSNSSNRFHVYFGAPTTAGANLDLDDISSFGPETTTITQQVAGVYRFSVHNFSNTGSVGNAALALSNARVEVFQGNVGVTAFNVPNRTGTLWTVFEINGTTITPINTMVDHIGSSGSITKPRSVPADAALIENASRTEKAVTR